MAHTVEKLPDAPIIVYVQLPHGNPMQEMPEVVAKIGALLDQQTEPAYVILDVRNTTVSLDDLMKAASDAARTSDAVLHHPNLHENVFVATDTFMRMALKGLGSASFGRVKVSLAETLEEALDYCRDKLRAESC